MIMLQLHLTCLIAFLFLAACSRSPVESRGQAMRPYEGELTLNDDLKIDSFIQGLQKNIDYLTKKEIPYLQFTFGDQTYSKPEYLAALQGILRHYKKHPSKAAVLNYISQHFDVYEVYGRDSYGEVLLTSYYGPLIPGSRHKTKRFSQPLYRAPKNIVEINLSSFLNEDYGLELPEKQRSVLAYVSDEKSVQGLSVVQAIPARENIDPSGAWPGRRHVLCYVDPIDAFFLQIQGSGSVRFANGTRMHLGYAGQNGRKYVPIGKFLLDVIPKEEMSLQKIEAYLHSLTAEERQALLNKNPSYVFFRKLTTKPITTLGTEVIAGRTIATDLRYFPKGAIAFLQFEKPVFDNNSETPTGSVPTARLVIDQDTGGAIKGGGRVDLFWGFGDEAKKFAGHFRNPAKLFYLAPKRPSKIADFISQPKAYP